MLRHLYLCGAGAALAASLLAFTSTSSTQAALAACSPSATILESPRVDSMEVQAKAINDRGDIVGFADSDKGSGAIHAILWKGGTVAGAIDLGVPHGFVSSEAYGINNDRMVFGVLYDKNERTFPFRWKDGRMTLLKGPNGRMQQVEPSQRNAINRRGEIVATLIVGGNRRAVRWTSDGRAKVLPGLPGHAWTDAFSINEDGVVSGWSRKLPNDDDAEYPVLWTRSGTVVPLKTAPERFDGIAEATNSSGLIVGYLGNQSDTEPEMDQFAVWQTRSANPRLMGRVGPNLIAEFVDVNDRAQAIGMTAVLNDKTGFILSKPVLWRAGWTSVRPLPVPAASRTNPVVVTSLNDINNRGAIVGNVYGLSAPDYSKLRRIDPVVWRCQFGR